MFFCFIGCLALAFIYHKSNQKVQPAKATTNRLKNREVTPTADTNTSSTLCSPSEVNENPTLKSKSKNKSKNKGKTPTESNGSESEGKGEKNDKKEDCREVKKKMRVIDDFANKMLTDEGLRLRKPEEG